MRNRRILRTRGLGVTGLMLAVGLALPPGQGAVAQTTFSGSSSREELLYRLDLLAAEMADIRSRLGGLQGTKQPVTAFPNVGDTGAMESEIRRLTAQVEELQNQVRQLTSNTSNRLGDLEFRLNELEGAPNTGGGNPPLVLNPGGGAEIESQTAAVPSGAGRGDLDRAIKDVNQGRFDQAEDRLLRFLSGNRGSPLEGEAWYWLGESQFVRGDRVQAARSYLDGYNTNKRGDYAPNNLYKLGVTLGRLGQLTEACLTLREVRSQFPNAPGGIARKADAESDKLACG